MLSVCKKIPSYIKIIPVYLRVIKKDNEIEFNITECEIPCLNGVFGALDQFKHSKIKRCSLHRYR